MNILIGSIKGGVGKTTIATNLAVSLLPYMTGDLLLVDTDPQASLSKFCDARIENKIEPHLTVSNFRGEYTGEQIKRHSKYYEHIIIDCAGTDSMALRSCLLHVADVFIAPCLPGASDQWSLPDMDIIFGRVKEIKPHIKGFIILNRVDTNFHTSLISSTVAKIKTLHHLSLFSTHFSERIAFRRALELGMSVTEYKKHLEHHAHKTLAACRELVNFTAAVRELE